MKVIPVEEAVALIPDGASIMIGGFMGVGGPDRLLDELARQKTSNLTVIANDACLPGKGIGKLVDGGQIARLTASHIGLNPKAQQQMMAGQMAVDLNRRARSPSGFAPAAAAWAACSPRPVSAPSWRRASAPSR